MHQNLVAYRYSPSVVVLDLFFFIILKAHHLVICIEYFLPCNLVKIREFHDNECGGAASLHKTFPFNYTEN